MNYVPDFFHVYAHRDDLTLGGLQAYFERTLNLEDVTIAREGQELSFTAYPGGHAYLTVSAPDPELVRSIRPRAVRSRVAASWAIIPTISRSTST